jgi:MerR family redox-sensitive transcriptional activator SoxR
LAEIREALEGMPHDRQATAAEWARVAAKWSETLQKRIDTLVRLKDSLESCIGCGCLTLGECPLRNPEDQLGRGKAGPVLLDLPA